MKRTWTRWFVAALMAGAFVAAGSFSTQARDNHDHARAGYGKCYKCYCKAFEGSYRQCSNCGHAYSDHY